MLFLCMRFFSLLLSLQTNAIVHNPCQACIYFEPKEHPFTTRLSKCTRFGERDSETGIITYEYADLCLKSDAKCGGKQFTPKEC